MKLIATTLGLFFLPFTTSAHHSLANFDRTTVPELEGEITRVAWMNPHVAITLNVDGVAWELESHPQITMVRLGVPRLQIGQRITVAGWVSAQDEPRMRLNNLLLPDGTEVLLDRQAQPRWSTEVIGIGVSEFSNIRADSAQTQVSGIFRVWPRTLEAQGIRWPTDLPLTPHAQSVYARWDRTQDPALQCEPPGMPRAQAQNPFAIQFVDRGNVIELRMEEFDQVRTIHMSGEVIEENPQRTPLGYSTGRWEDESTLVVRTTAISYTLFNQAGVPLGSSTEVVERFSLSEDQVRLNYDITVIDEEIFTEPVTGAKYWIWMPGDELLPYNCGED